MKTTLNSIDLVWIPQYSCYNHNFYINIVTSQIILAISDDYDGRTDYYYTSIENMRNGKRKDEVFIGHAYGSEFCIPRSFDRFLDYASKERAIECSFEFDNELS